MVIRRKKKIFGPKPAPGAKIFFGLMTPKKKFAYILVNGLMANFEFRSFWAKKWDFFCHGTPILPRPKKLPIQKISILPKLLSPE